MVLISVNAVLRLLKKSTCVGGSTHLECVAIYPFDVEPQSCSADNDKAASPDLREQRD